MTQTEEQYPIGCFNVQPVTTMDKFKKAVFLYLGSLSFIDTCLVSYSPHNGVMIYDINKSKSSLIHSFKKIDFNDPITQSLLIELNIKDANLLTLKNDLARFNSRPAMLRWFKNTTHKYTKIK